MAKKEAEKLEDFEERTSHMQDLAQRLVEGFFSCSASSKYRKIHLFGEENEGFAEELRYQMTLYLISGINKPEVKVVYSEKEPEKGFSVDVNWYRDTVFS